MSLVASRAVTASLLLIFGCSSSPTDSGAAGATGVVTTAGGGSSNDGGSPSVGVSGSPSDGNAGTPSGLAGAPAGGTVGDEASAGTGAGGTSATAQGGSSAGTTSSNAGTTSSSAGTTSASAGTSSGTGGGPALRCPAGSFVCDGFDSYPTGAAPTGIWTKTTRGAGVITVDTTHAFSGSNALHATGTLNADVAHITTPLSISASIVYVRFMMYTISYPSSTGVHSRLARIGTTGDSGPDSSYSLSSYNGTAIEKVDSIYLRSTAVHLNDMPYKNRWVCLEFEIDKSGGIGKVVPYIWIDGQALTLATAGSSTHAGTSTSWDPIAFEKFTIGLEGNQVDAVKGDYWLDDVVIAPARVGCPTQ